MTVGRRIHLVPLVRGVCRPKRLRRSHRHMTGRETVKPKPRVTAGCSDGDAPAGTSDPFRTSIRHTVTWRVLHQVTQLMGLKLDSAFDALRHPPIRRTRKDRKLFRLQANLDKARLLTIDARNNFLLSQIGSECLFEVLIQCYERGATKVTSNRLLKNSFPSCSAELRERIEFGTKGNRIVFQQPANLPCQEWTLISSSERPIGVIPDRIAHHVHIKEVVGKFYRLKQSRS